MKVAREIQKCTPHGSGVIVRVRFVALDDDGNDLVFETSDGVKHLVHFDIERVVRDEWKKDDTHESYVKNVAATWIDEAEPALEKIMLHHGLAKPKYDIPKLEKPKRF